MDFLKEYRLSKLSIEDIEKYTFQMVKTFGIIDLYEIYLKENKRLFFENYFFLGVKTVCNDDIIGGICFESKPIFLNQIYIDNLFVLKEYQKRKIATELINYISYHKDCFFNIDNINLYLFCEPQLQSFYEENQFILNEAFNENKVLKMVRKI